MSFKIKVKIIKFNERGYSNALQAAIDNVIKDAAREWLREVILHVPVYTGMAKASLLPLGRFLNVAIPINPIATRKYGDVATGELMGFFDFESDTQSRVSRFIFKTDVAHYLINEFTDGLGSPPLTHPTPWHSFAAGKSAFQKYLRANLKKQVPRVSQYLTREE